MGCAGRVPERGNLPVSGENAPPLPLYMLQKCSVFPSASLKMMPIIFKQAKSSVLRFF